MTVTAEQLDELERRVSSFSETDLSLVPIECTRAAQLVAIARAALAWKDAKARCDSTDIRTDGSSAFVALIRTHERLLAALEGTP